MAWKVSDVVNERMKFVLRVNEGERVTDLCREFEISRKTAYKFLERYKRFGAKGLFDESKRPAILARKTQPHIEKLILDTKRDRPTWGAPKLREFIQKKAPGIDLPLKTDALKTETETEKRFSVAAAVKTDLIFRVTKRKKGQGSSYFIRLRSSAPNFSSLSSPIP